MSIKFDKDLQDFKVYYYVYKIVTATTYEYGVRES